MFNNCITFDQGENEYVKEWANNETTESIIVVGPIPVFPHLAYNETSYQLCGLLLLMLHYFSKFINQKYKNIF